MGTKRLIVAYTASAAISVLVLVAAMTPSLSANDALLSDKTDFVVGAGWLASLTLFLILTAKTSFTALSRALNAVIASALLPLSIVFAPLLFCIFVSHGTCS